MNLWQLFEKGVCQAQSKRLSFHYEQGIDSALKIRYIDFAKWLRKTYVFPVRLNVYILNQEKITLRNGKQAYGNFRWFAHRPPIIKIPSKIEPELFETWTLDEIYESILSSLVHEITHYYQWVLDLEQSNTTSERQANFFRYRMIHKYKAETGKNA